MSITRIIFLLGAVLCLVALVALVKAGGGLRKRDSIEKRESLSRVFSPRRLLAQFIGLFAGLCFVGGAMALFQRDASDRVDWKIAVVMLALSQFLILCAWLLVRKRSDAP
jgi:hypothetical protein